MEGDTVEMNEGSCGDVFVDEFCDAETDDDADEEEDDAPDARSSRCW